MTLTELDFSFSYHKVRSIGPIVDIGGFVEERQQLLSVDEALVDRSVDVAKLVERTVELGQVGNENDEMAG